MSTAAKILVVEDDMDVRPLLEHILASKGYDVTMSETVTLASSFLDRQPFDFVITDVNLPDGSGLFIADKAIAAGIGTLVLTGHWPSLKGGSLNPYDYLLKPIRVSELLETIEHSFAEPKATV
jgi:two-component system, NtrC family, response regulator PilR